MRGVLYLSPSWPPEQRAFTAALHGVGARILGVGDTPVAALPADTRAQLHDYLQVPSMSDGDDVVRRATGWAAGRVERVETNWEVMVVPAAQIREALGLPGMTVDTVRGFRDKGVMRERLAAAGMPGPRSLRVRTRAEALGAARALGGRVVFKPAEGAGGIDTHIVDSAEALARHIAAHREPFEAQVEEFVSGEELTYETICVDGRIALESVSAYFPNVLDARRNEWISPIIACVRDLSVPAVQGGLALGRRSLDVLGMGSGFTHMEWFRRPDGGVVFGEIACRAPGAMMVDLTCFAFDADLYRAWARAVTWGDAGGPFDRRYNTALVFKRAQGRGRIVAHHGLDQLWARYRDRVARVDLLPVGHPRRDWEKTFLADGHVLVRHPTWEGMWEAAQFVRDHVHLVAR